MKDRHPGECRQSRFHRYADHGEVISGKWKALLLWQIHKAPARFGELKRLVPDISEKMLIQQLREMEADGIVHREVFPEVPPRVEYSITEFGIELDNALIPLARWGKQHAGRSDGLRPGRASAIAPHAL